MNPYPLDITTTFRLYLLCERQLLRGNEVSGGLGNKPPPSSTPISGLSLA
jgi:hypothetical protein